MISVILQGGLGNQIFQILAVIGYAMENNTTFCFQDVPIQVGNRKVLYWDTFFKNLYPHVKPFTTDKIYKEPHFHYRQIPLLPDGASLLGYFQSYKYFHTHRPTIMKLLDINTLQNEIRTKHKEIPFHESVCMHFRLGDYKNLQEYHYNLQKDYYEKALTQLLEDTHVNTLNILYFCEIDDIDQVQETICHLKMKFPTLTFQHINVQCQDWEEMLMMSLCKHHIIANSSFSYFGAYFQNTNATQKVYYPSTWFGPRLQCHDTSDMCLPNWTKIL